MTGVCWLKMGGKAKLMRNEHTQRRCFRPAAATSVLPVVFFVFAAMISFRAALAQQVDAESSPGEPASRQQQGLPNPADQARTVRVAAVSFTPVPLAPQENADLLETAFRQAAAGNARIAVAPEGVLEGYIVNQILDGEIPAEAMRKVAVTIGDPLIRRFQDLAKSLSMCLIFGFAERIDDDVFNTAVFIDHEGQISGRYHKMQLAEGYHADWWFNRIGTESRAFDTPFGRCGILICNDRWNPQLARIPALDGAQFLVIPSYGSCSLKQDEAVLSRSRETGLPVIEANVGVSLITSENEIVALQRGDELRGNTPVLTFADIVIPPPISSNPPEQDREEQTFLSWRQNELTARYEKRLEKIRQKQNPSP